MYDALCDEPVAINMSGTDGDSDTTEEDLASAAFLGDEDQTAQLLSEGRDPNQFNKQGCPALCLAAINGHTVVLEQLLSHEAGIDVSDVPTGNMALHFAAENGQRRALQVLLEHDAQVDGLNKRLMTPLMCAASHSHHPGEHAECIRLLLVSSADKHLKNERGQTALDLATEAGKVPAIMSMLSKDDWMFAQDQTKQARTQILSDSAVKPGTVIRVEPHGEGVYVSFRQKKRRANVHIIRFSCGEKEVRFKGMPDSKWSVLPPGRMVSGQFRKSTSPREPGSPREGRPRSSTGPARLMSAESPTEPDSPTQATHAWEDPSEGISEVARELVQLDLDPSSSPSSVRSGSSGSDMQTPTHSSPRTPTEPYSPARGGARPLGDPPQGTGPRCIVWDFMISYTQKNAVSEAIAMAIHAELLKRKKKVWLDVKMKKRDEEAMQQAVEMSRCVIAIVSGPQGSKIAYFQREFCLKELRWAAAAGVFVQPVVAAEDKEKITDFFQDIPADLQHLKSTNWEPIFRKDPEYLDVGVQKILKAADAAHALGSLNPESEPEPEFEGTTTDGTEDTHGDPVAPTPLAALEFDIVCSNKTALNPLCFQVCEQLAEHGLRVWQQRANVPKDSSNCKCVGLSVTCSCKHSHLCLPF